MVGVSLELVVIIIGFILVLGLMIESRMSLNGTVLDIQEQLDMMERGLEVVATVLQKIPEILPTYTINQNPLSQILEFFQGMNAPEGGADDSYANPQLRDDVGKYSDGETEGEA
jgi:hypothetical protein